jgi:hypothetical protein
MFSKLHTLSILFIFAMAPILGQDGDSTEVEEEGGREMFTMVDVSYSQDKGNTDFLSLYYGFSFSVVGNVGPLNDTEFSFDFSRSDDRLDNEPFSDDQYLTLKFDLWANQRISPFLFFQKSFDKTIGLEDRLNYGLGAKLGLLKGFSISYAFLAESEDYLYYDYTDSAAYDFDDGVWDGTVASGDWYYTDSSALVPGDYEYWDYYYYGDTVHFEYNDSVYYTYTDSAAYYYYTDSTDTPAESFYRHSIRPKFKVKMLDGNVVFDYRFYYKPRVDDFNDYLLEHELKISIATFYELLSIELNYSNKYNSRYDGTNIFNRDTYEFYKPVDESISIGLSFMF